MENEFSSNSEVDRCVREGLRLLKEMVEQNAQQPDEHVALAMGRNDEITGLAMMYYVVAVIKGVKDEISIAALKMAFQKAYLLGYDDGVASEVVKSMWI